MGRYAVSKLIIIIIITIVPTIVTTDLSPSLFLLLPLVNYRASVRRFVSLQFLDPRQSVGRLGRGISLSKGRYLHRTA
jgi:hypothetical protein